MEREQKKVLVVEDMAPVAAVIQEALEADGFEVECVSSAERAPCALATAPLLTAMRAGWPQLPVIVVSANATKLAEARQGGAASVLAKPFPLETLKRVVELALA